METLASILVVEDDPLIQDYIERILKGTGYQVLKAGDGLEALAILESNPVDLILADVIMPRMNGYQLYERVIQNPEWVAIPFLFLTARAEDSDIRYGKELGVDDYLTKPFVPDDLRAIVRGKLRRVWLLAQASAQPKSPATQRSDLLVLGKLHIDLAQHRVYLDETRIKLSAREFKLLKCLAQQANRVVPLQELIHVTHGLDTDRSEAGALLRPLIRSVRRKLGYSAGEMGCIESLRGVGYRLIPPT
jgi:two-component system response regulator VanR